MTAKQLAWGYFGAAALWSGTAFLLARALPGIRLLPFASDLLLAAAGGTLVYGLAVWKEHQAARLVRALEMAQRDLAAIIDNLPDSFYRTDPDGRIVRMSRCWHETLGYGDGELIGRNMAEFHADPQGRRKLLQALSDNNGQISQYEAPFRHKDGSIIWCSINARYAYDRDGCFLGVEGISHDVTERRRLEQTLRHIARHDPLTGLLNRGAFLERLEHSLARIRRNGGSLSLLFLDLDGFKQVNDISGHHAGDCLLKEVAQRLRQELREIDAAGRLGGDEFVLLLENTAQAGTAPGPLTAQAVAARLIEALRQPYRHDGREHCVSASIGIALYPEHGTSAETLLLNADQAMYRAKDGGKNRMEMCTGCPHLDSMRLEPDNLPS
ncbi:cyclic di-GMP phosphodiesterase Gmr [mine drainage metagenome]|uniref:Cyclic di-GMP phosphodiesterase Gmr n=1 Tax=mine drainage metagenome TaxID=410659 RepID=A0A1J5QPN7_9ZZZZ